MVDEETVRSSGKLEHSGHARRISLNAHQELWISSFNYHFRRNRQTTRIADHDSQLAFHRLSGNQNSGKAE